MSDPNFRNEFEKEAYQSLLPIEKKLIGGSLGLGIVLLVALVALNRFFPLGS